MKPVIARLGAAHVPQYRALMLHAYETAADAFTSTANERASEPPSWWLKRVADPSALSVSFGAFEAQDLVGAVSVEFSAKPKTCHKALIVGMFVLERVRGQGVGRALVRSCLEAASSRPGVQVITLTATEGNTPAISLYASLGFQSFGLEPMAIKTEQGLKGKVHMWRAL